MYGIHCQPSISNLMKITFHGAARTVTGSKHLLTLDSGKKILLDCGLFQGSGKDTDPMNREFNFDPQEIDTLILSHAHIDHCGNIPNLVKQGFKGRIICTVATADLCAIMLADTAHIQESDLKYLNKRRVHRGESALEPIYDMQDVEQSLKLLHPISYEESFKVNDELTLQFINNGHISGSASVNLSVSTKAGMKKIFFSGDIGRYNDNILVQPKPFPQADYILCESTYGNRLHPATADAQKHLLDIVVDTCVTKKGKLIIPAFSLGRTQEIVYELNNLKNDRLLPLVPVYVDSPLSLNATEVMRKHLNDYNDLFRAGLKSDPDPFDFPGLTYIQDAEDSKKLNDDQSPCIIISASGMAEAGRVKHHIKNNITDAKNTILIVGYCTPGSLGARLINIAANPEGNKEVHIFEKYYEAKAKIEVENSYSAHGDYNEMLRYLACQDATKVKKMFLIHGEYDVQQEWRLKLIDAGFKNVEIPEMKSEWEVS
jgi:metallo-beta-lactamase family protein